MTRKPDKVPTDKTYVVQKYLKNPLLIDDLKFDLRIYALVTQSEPLKIYLYREGLARFATVKYKYSNTKKGSLQMHLTNYAINKKSKNFVKATDEDGEQSSKRSLASIFQSIEE